MTSSLIIHLVGMRMMKATMAMMVLSLELEKDMVRSAKNNLLKREDILRIAVWGILRNRKSI